jgi:hypothetical protein
VRYGLNTTQFLLTAERPAFDVLLEGSDGHVVSPCVAENWSLSSQDGSSVVENADSHNPQRCPDCELWLRSLTQLDDHSVGEKERKHNRRRRLLEGAAHLADEAEVSTE